MKIRNKKRHGVVLGTVATVGAVASLVAGVTSALLSATVTSGSNKFTAGTVIVDQVGQPADAVCTIGPMSPGDTDATAGNGVCTFHVEYVGNVPAWLGMDVAITSATAGTTQIPYTQTTAPTAASGLYDGTANGLQLKITDDLGTTYISDGAGNAGIKYKDVNNALQTFSVSGTPALGSVLQLMVSTAKQTGSPTAYARTFTVHYSLPTGSVTTSNAYQAASSTLKLTFHAVQGNNNALPGACSSTNAGSQCTTLAWS